MITLTAIFKKITFAKKDGLQSFLTVPSFTYKMYAISGTHP